MKFKNLLIPVTALSIALSGAVFASNPHGKGNPHNRGSDAYRENSNKQSEHFSSRGRERAEERKHKKKHKGKYHKDKKSKKHRDNDRFERKRDHDDYRKYNDSRRDEYRDRRNSTYEKQDLYERQRYQERYQNNPLGSVIDQNVNAVKSKINTAIDNKVRDLTNVETRRERTAPSKPWWSIFGSN